MSILDQIEDLQKVKGIGTTLISFYITGGSDLASAISSLTKEMSASQNIKSKAVRKEVQNALKSIQGFFKPIKQVPSCGMAVFAGNGSLV